MITCAHAKKCTHTCVFLRSTLVRISRMPMAKASASFVSLSEKPGGISLDCKTKKDAQLAHSHPMHKKCSVQHTHTRTELKWGPTHNVQRLMPVASKKSKSCAGPQEDASFHQVSSAPNKISMLTCSLIHQTEKCFKENTTALKDRHGQTGQAIFDHSKFNISESYNLLFIETSGRD